MPHSHPSRAVRVHVVTVSTSRTAATDVSGPLVRDLFGQRGHLVVGASLVPDDPAAIGAALDALLAPSDVEAIVLTGGTGVSARDCTPDVVRARLDRTLPGFGELFRALSYAEIGPAAMLSDAVAGIARGRPVFALPGSTAACRLAMEKLILPTLSHLVGELHKETPLPAAAHEHAPAASPIAAKAPEAPANPEGGVVQMPAASAASALNDDLATGWRAALRVLGGEIRRGAGGEIPESLERFQPVLDVLHAAGDRAAVVLPDGRSWVAFGYPDLTRNSSKVLLVRDADPVCEVVALHRWPKRVGVCAEGDDGLAPSADLDPGPLGEERTGRAYEGAGRLFAAETATIWVEEGRRVRRWDGKSLGPAEPMSSVLGTLLLSWSQR